MALNQPQGFQPGLGQSNPNNFYTSGIAASQMNGTGSNVQAHKLNRGKNNAGVVVVPGPIQYVEQPVEVIKKVKKQVRAPATTSAAPIVQVNQLDPVLRNLIAETHAKVALLIMENNRIKWRIAQRDAEISRLRATSGGVVHTTTNAPVIRTSGTIGTSTVVNRGPVTTIGQPTVFSQLQTNATRTVGAPGLPITTTSTTGGIPITSTVRPGGATVIQGGQPR